MQVDWFIDFLSPYAYLQQFRLAESLPKAQIQPRPIVLGAVLDHWGQLGPAEIPPKKVQTFRYARFLAAQRGLPFVAPPCHPFNPIPLLRLCIAAGESMEAARIIYQHVFTTGADLSAPDALSALGKDLGIDDVAAATSDPAVKQRLRENTDAAIALGVYGVPTLAIGHQIFWGDDVTEMAAAYLADPSLFDRPDYAACSQIPAALSRKP
ncbi:MAG: 2-hydroxychromene-2-carboxylate isomerase [Neomegalonema sp.]|nr:2-hydroxychromene-2-carboxylate isomerase [Neomegalonema sp.]